MPTYTPLLNGLSFTVRITRRRGLPFLGQLEDKETGEVVFEDEFPSYRDAYWSLMEMDGLEYLAHIEVADTNSK